MTFTTGGKITAQAGATPKFGTQGRNRNSGYPGGSIIDSWLSTWVPALNGTKGPPDPVTGRPGQADPIIYGTDRLPGPPDGQPFSKIFESYMGGPTSGITNSLVPDIGASPTDYAAYKISAAPITLGFLDTVRQWKQIRQAKFVLETTVTGFSNNSPRIQTWPYTGPVVFYRSTPDGGGTNYKFYSGGKGGTLQPGSQIVNGSASVKKSTAWFSANDRWIVSGTGVRYGAWYVTFDLEFPISGQYTFSYGCDDVIWIEINDTVVIPRVSGTFRTAPINAIITVSAGTKKVGFYVDNSGGGPHGFYFEISYLSQTGSHATTYLSSLYAIEQTASDPELQILPAQRIAAFDSFNPAGGVGPEDEIINTAPQPLATYFNSLYDNHYDQVRYATPLTFTSTVCHTSCHSSCHGSRGRR